MVLCAAIYNWLHLACSLHFLKFFVNFVVPYVLKSLQSCKRFQFVEAYGLMNAFIFTSFMSFERDEFPICIFATEKELLLMTGW